jgi:hypothetical protein
MDPTQDGRGDKPLFFGSWIVAALLSAYVLVELVWKNASSDTRIVSFGAGWMIFTLVMSALSGLVVALALFGLRRLLSKRR